MTDPHNLRDTWRSLGRRLAELRKAAGYTQHTFAPLVLYGRSTIANAETGHQRPNRAFWQRCDRVLHTGGVLAAEYDRIDALAQAHQKERRPAEHNGLFEFNKQHAAPHEAKSEHFSGQCFGLDGETIVTAMVGERMQQVRLSRRVLLEAVSGGLAAPLIADGSSQTAGPGWVDPALVDHFAAMRALLVKSDNRLGATAVRPTALQQLGYIAQFRRAARGRLRDALLGMEARWAEFAGWLSDDLGDHAAGNWWLTQALTMAQEAEDREFTTYIFARMAQRAVVGTDRDRVLGLARTAGRIGSGRPQVRAFAALQQAQGHALAGEIYEFQRTVEQAHHLVAHTTEADDELGGFCTPPYVWAQEGDGWLRLGCPRAVLESFARALAAWPESYRRDRGVYLARTAMAYVVAGDPERAAATGTKAVELARLTGSARIWREIAYVAQRLEAYRANPEVAEFIGRVNA